MTIAKQRNAQRWANMHVRADQIRGFDATAARLCAPAARARYQGVTDRLSEQGLQPVPWWFIAVVSEREYGGPPRIGIDSWPKAIRWHASQSTSRKAVGRFSSTLAISPPVMTRGRGAVWMR